MRKSAVVRAEIESADVGAVSVRRMGDRAISARKMSRDALIARAPTVHRGLSVLLLNQGDNTISRERTTIGKSAPCRIPPEVFHALPNYASSDKGHAREDN
jgi:hypothetical protein